MLVRIFGGRDSHENRRPASPARRHRRVFSAVWSGDSKIGADAVAQKIPSGSMGWNGNRDWGIHFCTSSYPLGFDSRFGSSPGGEQVTVFHEYSHAVQQTHIQSRDHGEITYDSECAPAGYDLGCWAIAYLLNREGQAALIGTLYPMLNERGWDVGQGLLRRLRDLPTATSGRSTGHIPKYE